MTRKLFADYLNEIKKEDLYKYYETENHTIKECCFHFNISQSTLMRVLAYYKIKKSKDACTKNIKKSKLLQHGNENYNNQAKIIQTNNAKYGVDNQFQRKELFPEIYSKKIKSYGSINNIKKNFETRVINSGSIEESYSKQQETYKATCQARYGVQNIAQLEETKEKIRQATKQTFLDRYGATCYWLTDGATRSAGSKDSKPNLEFAKKLNEAGIDYEREFKLDSKFYDFKVGNTLIEIDPTPTHNINWSPFQKPIEKEYHKIKNDIAAKNGLQCIHIFDWEDQDKIITMLKAKTTVGARLCEIKEITALESATFLNTYHIQGCARDRIRLGLFYQSKLRSVMTFGKPRFNKNYQFELLRYCCADLKIIGGANKLFKYFITNYLPESIISYCDLSKFTGEVYNKLGFKKIRRSAPSCHWYNIKTKQHILDSLLRQRGFDILFNTNYGKFADNQVLMLEANFLQVYDCGQLTFGWKAKD